VFAMKVPHNSSPSVLVVRNHPNQCCALVWGSYTGFYYSVVLGLRLTLKIFTVAQTCESAKSQTC
jgi:hypothetical protein